MSRDQPEDAELITSMDQLTGYFRAGIKAPEQRRVGMEHEKFMLRAHDASAAPYEGESGIGRLFEGMCARFGYEPAFDGDNIVAAVRENDEGLPEALTIEPGGQFELSGAPVRWMRDSEIELDRHLAEVREIAQEIGLVGVGTGANGLHDLDDVPWMPKSRYGIMRRYMSQVGTLGHWMMKMTCTVQANFDYTSEQDAADMLRTALWISPIVSALFATSPIRERKPSGYMSTRCFFWTDTDKDRCGFPPFMQAEEDFGFEAYANYALDVPMYLMTRQGRYIDMAGHSFRRFLEDGHQGHSATMGDFALHLSTLFPEVRLKRYIEVRGADCGPRGNLLALPALWKGLLYDLDARRAARDLLSGMTFEARERLFTHAIRWSLDGPVPDTGHKSPRTIRDLASDLIDIAAGGLDRLALADPAAPLAGPDERRYLEPLRAAIEGPAASPAHALLERWKALGGDTAAWMLEQAL